MLPLALPVVEDVGLLKRFASEQSRQVRGRRVWWGPVGGVRGYTEMMFLPPERCMLTVHLSYKNDYIIILRNPNNVEHTKNTIKIKITHNSTSQRQTPVRVVSEQPSEVFMCVQVHTHSHTRTHTHLLKQRLVTFL